MGYTHYWYFAQGTDQGLYNEALDDVREIVKASTDSYNLCNGLGERNTEPELLPAPGVAFNGCEEESHETFYLSCEPNGREFEYNPGWLFNFCKTASKEYDTVVVACLCTLKDVLGDSVRVSSDGDVDDWRPGLALAKTILGRDIQMPLEDEE